MERIFRTRIFTRWAKGVGLTDEILCKAVAEMVGGLIDANLGGGIIKKRVALPGRGKRGGGRTLVATNFAGCWFFLYGFEKSNSADIAIDELKALRQVAEELLELDDYSLLVALRAGKIIEVSNGYDQTEKPHPG